MDAAKIMAKAKKNGLLTKPESEYTEREIFNFVVAAGFSTNETVTQYSGRGVGMDVVKQKIHSFFDPTSSLSAISRRLRAEKA